MKIELIKKTTKTFGKEYYYVSVDGDNLISETWCSDLEKANEHFTRIIDGAKQFPADKEEVIKTTVI